MKQQNSRIDKTKSSKYVPDKVKDHMINQIFNEDQVQLLNLKFQGKSINGIKWSNQTIKQSLKYRYTSGGTGYEEFRKLIPLPSQRTLSRRIQKLKFEPGILYEIFELLKHKVTEMTYKDRDCIIMTDEMAIEEGIEYDSSLKQMFGNVTFPLLTKRKAKNGMVVMLGGIQTHWKVIVAYELTDSINNKEYGIHLKKLILKIVSLAEDIGLRVHLNTNDMGPLNIKMWKAFDIKCIKVNATENPEINYLDLHASIVHPNQDSPQKPTRRLHFMADVPHLFKNICQALINNRSFTISDECVKEYNLISNKVDFTGIEDLFNVQESFKSSLKLAPKLEEFKLHPTNFEKMKVKTSFHVLHRDVSSALRILAAQLEHEDMEDTSENEKEVKINTYLTTAWFIEFINKWFYLMTSRGPQDGALNPKYKESYNENLLFLKECIHVFKYIIVGNRKSWRPIQTGLIISTTSVIEFATYCFEHLKYEYLLTGRLTQDALENLFCTVRIKQRKPSAVVFKNILKIISITQIVADPSNSSYDADDRTYINDFLEIIKEFPENKNTIELSPCPNYVYTNYSRSILTKYELLALYNLAGHILMKIEKNNFRKCDDCFSQLGSNIPIEFEYSKLTYLKSFKVSDAGYSKLFYPTEEVFVYFRRLENIFNYYMSSDKCFAQGNIRDSLICEMKKIPHNFLTCHNISSRIITNFVGIRLKFEGQRRTHSGKRVFSSRSMN